MTGRKGLRPVALAAALFALAGGVAACGSSSDDDGGGSSSAATSAPGGGSGGDAAVTEAQGIVREFEQRPTRIEVSEPITRAIPEGKQIDFLTCSSPGCARIADYFKQAVAKLGWTAKVIEVDATADAINRAYDTAIRDKPDGLVVVAVSSEVARNKLSELERMNVPVVTVQDPDEPFGPIIASVYTHESSIRTGRIHADALIAAGCAEGTTVYIDVGGFIVLEFMRRGFEDEVRRLAPEMKVERVDIAATKEGDAQTAVIGAIRSNPDTTCVFGASDPLITGLPQAVRAAGVSDPLQYFTDFGGDTTLQYVKDGIATATNQGDPASWAYLLTDTLARHFAGQSVRPDQDALQNIWIVNKDNALDAIPESNVQDMVQQYERLWGKG